MTFSYLGVEVTSGRNIYKEIRTQVKAEVSGYPIWRNMHMTMERKQKQKPTKK